jgi:hypothetical protein
MQLMTKKTNVSVVYKNESRSIIYSRSLINTNVVYETSTTVSVTGMGSVVISLYRTLKKHQEIYIGIHKNDVNKCRTTCNRNLVSNNIVLYVVDANIWKRICAGFFNRLYIFCIAIGDPIIKRDVGMPLTGKNPPHVCACPKS